MAFEDFTTYIEVDNNNKLTVTALQALAVDVNENENVWLYKDKGVDFFDALDIDFDIRIENSSVIDCNSGVALTNVIGGVDDFAPTDFTCRIKRGSADYRIVLTRGNWLAHDPWVCQPETHYHCTIERAAGNDTVSLKIFSNAARTALLATLVQANFGTEKWRYVYGFINRNIGINSRYFDGYTQNLDLKETAPPVHYGSATLTGVGTLSAIGSIYKLASATLSGVGSLSAIGSFIVTGASTLSGIGSLTAAGVVVVIHYGAAILSGIGSLTASAITTLAGKATLSGVGTLSAIGTVTAGITHYGSATLSGIGTLVASAVTTLSGKATLSGTGALSAIGGVFKLGSATLSGVGSLTAKAIVACRRILRVCINRQSLSRELKITSNIVEK